MSAVDVVVIWVDEVGCSHFADRTMELLDRDFAPPAPPLATSEPIPAADGVFFSMAPGWFGDWHPTPCRQYFVQTTGMLEVTVGDGETRRLTPGSVVFVEDTTGSGHTTRVVSDEPVCGVFLQLPN